MSEEKNISEKTEKIDEEEVEIFSNKIKTIYKNINALKTKYESLIEKIKDEKYELQYGLSFFESKQDLMLIYISNLLNFISEKIKANQSITNLPFLTDNIKITSLIERIKVIEMKLQNLINKTTSITNKSTNNEVDYKPKILSIVENNENEESNEEENLNTKKNNKKKKTYFDKNEIYKIKNSEIDFYENKEEKTKRKKQLERDKEKIRNSEMLKDLRNEISDKPINYDNNNNSHYNKYMKEVEEYEKDHFVNVQVPKKVIKQLKKKDNNTDDLTKLDKELKILSNTIINQKYDEKSFKGKDNKRFNNSFKKEKKFVGKKRKK